MKTKLRISLIITGLILMLIVACCFLLRKDTDVKTSSMAKETVEVNYRDTIYLAEYFEEDDNYSNVELYAPSGKRISVKNGYFFADTMGTYKFVMPQSERIYKFKVKDLAGPIVSLKGSTTVYLGEEVSIQSSVIDNVNADFDLKNATYTVKKGGKEVDVEKNQFVAEELGEYLIEYDLKDAAGNKAEPVVVTCKMPKVIIKPIGERIEISNELLNGLLDTEKDYSYGINITRVTRSSSVKVAGHNFTIDNNSVYVIRQTAKSGDETITLDYMYRPENLLIYNFDNQDISMIGVKPIRLSVSAATSVKEEVEGDSAVSVQVDGETWIALNIAGLEPNTVYDSITFDVNLLQSPLDGKDSLKLSFYNSQDQGGHSLVWETGKESKAAFSDIKTNGLGTATVYAYIHAEGTTEFTMDNIVVQKNAGVNMEKGIWVEFKGSAVTDSVAGKNGYSLLHMDVTGEGFGTLTISATKDRGLKPNTEYLVILKVECDGAYPSFLEDHGGVNDFVLGKPGGEIRFVIKTDANGTFEKKWDTVYLNTPTGLTYVDFVGIEIHETKDGDIYQDAEIVTGKDSVYGVGITVVPERLKEFAASFEVTQKTLSQGENAGKKYNGIGNITSEGWAKLTISADETAGLKPNTKYKVVLDVNCDGEYPSFYEHHEGGDEFVLGTPGGQISFIVITDSKGTFAKAWDTLYLNTPNKLTYVDFVGIEITETSSDTIDEIVFNDGQIVTGKDSVYGAGITVVPERIKDQALFEITEKAMCAGINAGKTYNGIGNITREGWAKLSVNADETAGLKANTEYVVVVDVVCDGQYPAFIEQHENGNETGNDFVLSSFGGEIRFTIKTDANGTFKKIWTTVYLNGSNGLSYADFINVKVIENADAQIATGADSVYGEGVYVYPSELDNGASFVRTEKTVTEGENAGKKYNGIDNITREGFSKLTVKADENADLKPNTEYRVTVDVLLDGTWPAFFDQHDEGGIPANDFIFGAPNGQIKFTIMTDANGTFEKVWDTIYLNKTNGLTYADFVAVAIQETAYGAGIDINMTCKTEDGRFGSYFLDVENTFTEGKDAGKLYYGIGDIIFGGWSGLTITGREEAGLKPNTEYNVVVDVACDGDGAVFYDQHEDGGRNVNDFILGAPGGKIRFTIKTDANGTFEKDWTTIYLNTRKAAGYRPITYANFTDVTITEASAGGIVSGEDSVYGPGVTIVPGMIGGKAQFLVTEKTVTEGENAGKKYNGLGSMTHEGASKLTVKADEAAGLKANTEYRVTIDVVCDGARPAYYDTNNSFILSNPGGQIKFEITTDANGAFEKVWESVWLNCQRQNETDNLTYVDFTGIKIEKIHADIVTGAESVYGEGVSIVPSMIGKGQFALTEKTVAEGENAGLKYNGITHTRDGYTKLTISATKDAQLEPLTDYNVVVDVVCDGTEGKPTYHDDTSDTNRKFVLKSPGGKITFKITTDIYGTFTQEWSQVYLNSASGWTYLDFTDITITKANSGDGVLLDGEDSVYGKGVIVAPIHVTDKALFTRTTKEITEGANAGKKYNGIGNITRFGWAYLSVAATDEAGLEPYTDYQVVVDVVTDGNASTFTYTSSSGFTINDPTGDKITFTITTDKRGEFSKTWTDGYLHPNNMTYIDFINVTITKMASSDGKILSGADSVYGEGIIIAPTNINNAVFARTTKEITEGAKAGKKYNGIGGIQNYGFSELVVAVNYKAGLKPNTEYTVVVDVLCDGTEGKLSYHDDATDANRKFILKSPGGKIQFTATTDANGEFEVIWSKVYMNNASGWTYLDFTGITITEK